MVSIVLTEWPAVHPAELLGACPELEQLIAEVVEVPQVPA
jgi:hypothetical protein